MSASDALARVPRPTDETPGHPGPETDIRPVAIDVRDLGKQFHFYEHRTTTLREVFIRLMRRKPVHVRRPAFSLRDINLRIAKGESVGIIGYNGSGKSTLLRLIAGIYTPTSGSVYTDGRLGVVLGLGTGFHGDLTGAENVAIFAAVMGLTRKETEARLDEIVEFADIGDFIAMPVKYYSSGMSSRLAFSVTVCTQPDILLLDEVLAVGDATFTQKCVDRLKTFQTNGGTVVLVSHNLGKIKAMCARTVWIENGSVRMDGETGEVIRAYQRAARHHSDRRGKGAGPPARGKRA